MLVSTLPSILPSLDFGLGAEITNRAAVAATAPAAHISTQRAARTRLGMISGGFLVAVLLVSATVGWPAALGISSRPDLNLPVTVALSLTSLSIVAASGVPTLIGFKRNVLLTVVQGSSAIVSLLVVLVLSVLGATEGYLVASASTGLAVSTWVAYICASRSRPMREARRVDHSPSDARPISFRHTARPMLVILTSTPLAIQSGRLIIAWLVGVAAVAGYSATFSVFAPLYSVAQIGGRSLWAEFAEVRESGVDPRPLFRRSLLITSLVGFVLASGFVVLGPVLVSFATSGKVSVPFELFLVLGFAILVISVHQPSGMFLTDAAGLRFQAFTSVAMAVVSVALGVALAGMLGVLSPAIGLATGLLVCQALPCLVVATRRMRVPR